MKSALALADQITPALEGQEVRREVRPKARVAEVDVLRALAIFGVLILHSGFQSRFSQQTLLLQANMARLFDWAVLAFFFSSGFMYDTSASFGLTLKKRLISLILPFFLYNALYNVAFAGIAAAGWIQHPPPRSGSQTLIALLIQSPAFQLYYLPYLFLIAVGICGLDKLVMRRLAWMHVTMLIVILVFYLFTGYPAFSYGPAYRNFPLYVAAFLIGVLGRPLLEKPAEQPWMMMIGLVVALLMLTVLHFRAASLAVPPLLVGTAQVLRRARESRILLSMGAMSGSIYVWHTPVLLPAMTRLLAKCSFPSVVNLLGSVALTLAVCMLIRLGADALCVRLMNRRLPRWITL